MKINKLKLRDIVKNYEIKEQEFEYAGTNGIAELLGWQIIFFCKKDDLDNTVVVSFHEIDNIELINIANSILKFIGMNIRFGDPVEVMNRIYGTADFTDSLYEDIIRYHYIISPDLFMAFGLKDNTLSSLEIVTDENIIKEIISVRKSNDLYPMSLNKELIQLLPVEIKNHPNDLRIPYECLIKFKNSGMDKDSMLENLEKLRSTSDSETEDILLELMDFVVGFCSPGWSIF